MGETKFELDPMNKYIVIDPVKEDERIGKEGLLVAPDNAREKQYRVARIVALSDCEETAKLSVGMMVLYDHVGAVTHRIGRQSFTTVKALNVVSVIRQKPDADPLAQAIVATHG